jgi:hypothetical protein
LHEDVDHVTILIYSPPKILALSVDGDEEFIQIPRVAETTLAAFQATRILTSEFSTPLANRFVGDTHAAFSEHVVHVAKAQTESIIESDSLANDLGWKTVPNVSGTASFHPGILPCDELT